MKRKLLRIASCLITLSLIAFGVHRLNSILTPIDEVRAYQQINTFHHLPKNSVEVIVYGSSHAYRSVVPMQMYRDYGIAAYNYGMSTQRINTTTLFVKDSLLTQKPKLAIIETYFINNTRHDIDMTLDIAYTRYLNVKGPVLKYLRKCFGNSLEQYLSYFLPICAFHENWNTLTEDHFDHSRLESLFLKTMGFKESTETTEVTLYTKPKKESRLREGSVKAMDEIVEACAESGTEVLFLTVPYSKEDGFPYGEALKKYASEHGCAYLNLFEYIDDLGLDTSVDFSDAGHLNNNGAAKLTSFLSQYIASHYQLSDARLVPGNLWERIDQGQVTGISDI